MNNDQLRSLQELQNATAQFTRTIGGLRRGLPEEVDGSDSTGAVRVTLDRHGQEMTVEIADHWDHQVEPDELGAAVLVAAQAASASLAAEMQAGLEREGREEEPAGEAPPAPDLATNEALAAPPMRSLQDLTEDLLRDMTALRSGELTVTEAQVFTGSAADGQVSVTLSGGGMTGCEIEPAWASRRLGRDIGTQVDEATREAAALQRAARGALDDLGSRLDGMFGDALGHLGELARQQGQNLENPGTGEGNVDGRG